jgi:hypothetical protein
MGANHSIDGAHRQHTLVSNAGATTKVRGANGLCRTVEGSIVIIMLCLCFVGESPVLLQVDHLTCFIFR